MRHPATPFLVSLSTLVEGGNRVVIEGTGEDVGIGDTDAELEGGIVLEGTFYRVDQHVEIQAEVRGAVRQACDRCVSPVVSPLRAPLRLYCEKRPERDRRSAVESREQDDGLLYHDGHVLDLREEVREVVLLEVPWHPLCRSDCRGLCPRCGKNLNEGDCSCPPPRAPSPWDALLHPQAPGPASDLPDRKE
jgi:uncharacterized protein